MSAKATPEQRRRPKLRWLILGAALLFAALAWTAVGVAYLMRPGLALWASVVTIGAISLEVLVWTAAGVFGWGFLAKRRAVLERIFTRRQASAPEDSET